MQKNLFTPDIIKAQNMHCVALTTWFFLPISRVCSFFSEAGKFCLAHGLRQPKRDVKSDVRTLLAGDQWWPRTSGGRLHSVWAIAYLLRHRISNFVKGNKRNLHKQDWLNSLSVR